MNDEQLKKVIRNASIVARSNFKYFWRELFWNYRRTEEKCDFISVLCSISDTINGEKVYEDFWLNDVIFDGKIVYGTIHTQPSIITNVTAGAACNIPFSQLKDWIYVNHGIAYGAFTIQAQRNFMSLLERQEHDAQWGFDFGDPIYPKKYPENIGLEEPDESEQNPRSFLGMRFGKKKDNAHVHVDWALDHPEALQRMVKYDNVYKRGSDKLNEKDSNGWTALHNHALAGNRYIVDILIKKGADIHLTTPQADTALDLAKRIGWHPIITSLSEAS